MITNRIVMLLGAARGGVRAGTARRCATGCSVVAALEPNDYTGQETSIGPVSVVP